VWGIFLECEVSLMASWFAAEMRTEFCDRPDHIAEPSKHTAAYGSKLNVRTPGCASISAATRG
jgi:hypothetical protein